MNYGLMDLHNHTTWSDGIHSPKEIIENAISCGIESIGISDHFATTKCNSITVNKLERYIKRIEKLKKLYESKINVIIGVEICTSSTWCKLNELDTDKLNKLDFILFEYVESFSDSFTLNDLKDFREKLTCNVGLAHTNPFMLMEKYDLDYIAKFLSDEKIFWEINVNEGYEYFDKLLKNIDTNLVEKLFKVFKEKGVEITVGSDTHSLDWYDLKKLKLGNVFAQYKM
ncbi:CpsB/CapC family capsule biosynthesis tyrosine phosphatase [Clostridium estertheticum]|uniref:CpsB/CapC family capsule biosynthesis tyrosine phosphatase n=1 Tax=Clostridium estertheticum TaxID=238834 RepID=UPI001C7D5803|nr:CpsB/CapC family capsule biosynthesis tyrosine phosphatase [Clostridium estertheticum]MBX4263122.1 PHP domain-containing protein [Clostridium estertheticum]WLC89435.1 PHP domain-containing protein [Clostridium estertheticum]